MTSTHDEGSYRRAEEEDEEEKDIERRWWRRRRRRLNVGGVLVLKNPRARLLGSTTLVWKVALTTANTASAEYTLRGTMYSTDTAPPKALALLEVRAPRNMMPTPSSSRRHCRHPPAGAYTRPLFSSKVSTFCGI
jgi:hypothetical protein